MEFISGHSLKNEVEQNGVFDDEKLRKIICKIGQALDYIHEKNILHLDIKPSNILMDQNNNPKLIDFGISKKYDLSNDQETSTALLAASKGYASIEQYDSEGIQVFTPRPDIYSLGATMYYLITGQVPTESILRSTKGLQNPRELNPNISENTENVILKAMALNAADRYQTVMDMLLDLGFDPEVDKIDLSQISLPDYPEITSKMSDEPFDFDAEDRTIFHTKEIEQKKWKRKYAWLFLAIPFLISGIMAFILFGNFGKKLPDDASTGLIPVENQNDTVNNNVFPPDFAPIDSTALDQISNPVDNQPLVEEETRQEIFERIFNEAVIAYNQQNFSRSLELINRAETHIKNTNTERYRALNEQELEKIEIENRKKDYEVLMNFGNFAVVKRKSDDKVGAIDEKGILRIPCIYINSEPSGENRLFQRDDYLYDEYAPTGVLIDAGVSGLD